MKFSLANVGLIASAYANANFIGQIEHALRQLPEGNDCRRHLQIVHVQDSTDTFQDDIIAMIESDSIKHLMLHLEEQYGKVDYTFATFHDKLRPVTGHGVTGGWWTDERWDLSLGGMGSANTCYTLMGELTNDPDRAQEIFNNIPTNGGKDFPENQWDALRRVAIDPSIVWDLRDYDDEGRPIIRIALLVTDDGAHTAENTFADNPRNANREWLKQSGPWHNASSQPTQACDMDASRARTNNINTEYGNLSSGTSSGSDIGGDGACFGWNAQKAGVFRSLKGSLSFMEHYYGFGEDEEVIGMVECGPLLNESNCHDYYSFTHCCTPWGLTFRKGSCVEGTTHYELFPDFEACENFGGRFARCHPSMNAEYGFTGSEDHPMARAIACTADTPEWQSAKDKEPSDAFWAGWTENHIDAIEEYPYDDSIWEKDCASFEYPDPKDPRYAAPFIEKGIFPVIIASPPSGQFIVDPESDLMASYDVSALRMAANNCPGLEHDPYTTYACNERLFGHYYCYAPSSYPDLYPYDELRSDPSLWAADDETSWWRTRCDTEECGAQWWTQCMEVEYKGPLDVMNSHGASTHFQFMDPNHLPSTVVDTLDAALEKAMLMGPECPATTTTLAPTTTSTTTLAPTTPATTTPATTQPPTTTSVATHPDTTTADATEGPTEGPTEESTTCGPDTDPTEPCEPECPCSSECDPCGPCACACYRPPCSGESETVLKIEELPIVVNVVISDEQLENLLKHAEQ